MRPTLLILALVAGSFAAKCGVSNIRPNVGSAIQNGTVTSNAVTGSQESTPFSWPWQAIVCVVDWFGDCAWQCSATIVGQRWAITSANCVASRKPSDLKIRSGVFHSHSQDKQEMSVRVQAVYLHPQYNPSGVTKQNNIAIIETKESFTFGDYVQPICLPADDGDAINPDQKGWVTGWGSMRKGGAVERTLQQAQIEFNDPVVCDRSWGRTIYDSEICAGDGAKTICSNDEGDPLAVQAPSGQWFMHGSAAISDSACKMPGIFSKISFYCPWINALSGGEVECIKRE